MAAVDAALGKLLVALRKQKLYDNAAIVVASDHGQSLGANGEETHGVFLYDETIHVPLLVRLPRRQTGMRRVRGRVRLLDLAPTVLEIGGAPVPSQMQSQSLLRIANSNPIRTRRYMHAVTSPDKLSDAAGWNPGVRESTSTSGLQDLSFTISQRIRMQLTI